MGVSTGVLYIAGQVTQGIYLCANSWKGFIGQLASSNADRDSEAWINPPMVMGR
jgi:hypothetical protein